MSDTDLYVQNEGSIFLLRPLSDAGRDWIADNVCAESWQMFGDAIAVEHRFIGDIVSGAQHDGLVVE
jgi:hypothetical protein